MTITDRILSLNGATVTLNDIRKQSPCEGGWRELLAHLGKTKADDTPVSLITILDSNGLDDAMWCFRALPAEYDPAIRLMLCNMVEPALKFVPEGEDRPRQAIETARRHARGEASDKELGAAWDAAMGAAMDASMDASMAAARAASMGASMDASMDAAMGAAKDAAMAAAMDASMGAAMDAAWDAAMDAARDEQARIFRAHFT